MTHRRSNLVYFQKEPRKFQDVDRFLSRKELAEIFQKGEVFLRHDMTRGLSGLHGRKGGHHRDKDSSRIIRMVTLY